MSRDEKQFEKYLKKAISSKDCPPDPKNTRNLFNTCNEEESSESSCVFFFKHLKKREKDLFSEPTSCFKSLILIHAFLRLGKYESLIEIRSESDWFQSLLTNWTHHNKPKKRYGGSILVKYIQLLMFKIQLHKESTVFDARFSRNFFQKSILSYSFSLKQFVEWFFFSNSSPKIYSRNI